MLAAFLISDRVPCQKQRKGQEIYYDSVIICHGRGAMEFVPPGARSDNSSVDHEAESSNQKQDWAIPFKDLAMVTHLQKSRL